MLFLRIYSIKQLNFDDPLFPQKHMKTTTQGPPGGVKAQNDPSGRTLPLDAGWVVPSDDGAEEVPLN